MSFLSRFWKSKPEPRVDPGIAVLRDERAHFDSRKLTASFNEQGDLVIEGRDFGQSVERAFGYSEYEWVWTIKATDLPRLQEALASSESLLTVLKERFSDENAAGLMAFFEEHDVPFEKWSRVGD